MSRQMVLTGLFLSVILGLAVRRTSGTTDPIDPPPQAAYLGCITKHHLAGDNGTSLYRTVDGWRLATLEYIPIVDPNYWQYRANSLKHPRWAFAKYPDCCGQYAVYVRVSTTNSAGISIREWRPVEDTCRILASAP